MYTSPHVGINWENKMLERKSKKKELMSDRNGAVFILGEIGKFFVTEFCVTLLCLLL